MFEVIYMKAEFEPWWMFDGWEETILSRHSFDEILEAREYMENMLLEMRAKYENENMKNQCFYAFWTAEERQFCEACDDDLQIFHGVMLFFEGKPYSV